MEIYQLITILYTSKIELLYTKQSRLLNNTITVCVIKCIKSKSFFKKKHEAVNITH